MQPLVQAAVGHVVEHKKELLFFVAPSPELDQVPVTDVAEAGYFGSETLLAVLALHSNPFHRHEFTARESALVHGSKPAASEYLTSSEVLRRLAELLEGEHAQDEVLVHEAEVTQLVLFFGRR